MNDAWPSTWQRRAGAILVLALVLVAALGASDALAAKKKKPKPAPAAPSYYTLANPRLKCRANYTRQTVTITVRKHRRTVSKHQVRCVYTGSRGAGGNAAVSFPVNLPTAGVSVTVIPSAEETSFTITADQILDVGGDGLLAGNEGSGLSVALGAGPTHGVLALSRNGTFRYTPAASFSGIDSFTYRTVNGSGNSSAPATVKIAVTPVAIAVGAYTDLANATLAVGAPGVLTGDTGSALTARLISSPGHGLLTLNADGSFSYTPASGFSGADAFSFEAVDSAGQPSNAETVTIDVGAQPPTVVSESFAGVVGNTPLQVGGSPGAGPEVYDAGVSALANDQDPGGGTLTTTPATITTTQNGIVTLAANGTFNYQPPVGLESSSDSFSYQVDTSEGTSAQATATIFFENGARVWYVNSSAPAGGNGTAGAPFNALASVNSPGGSGVSGDTIFLYGGGPTYAGGAVLTTNEKLIGQSAGLTVAGEPLLAASGPNPVITSSGVGVTLAGGDTLSGVSVTNSGGDGVDDAGGAVTINDGSSIAGAHGDGIHATGLATLTVNGASITGSTIDGILLDGGDGSLSVNGATITGSGGDGIHVGGGDGLSQQNFSLLNNTISGHGTAISLTYAGTASGEIESNDIGTAGSAASGSVAGDGIYVESTGAGAEVTPTVSSNLVYGIAVGGGIMGVSTGGGKLWVDLEGNQVATDATSTGNGVTLAAGTGGSDVGQVCVDPAGNTVTAGGAGTNAFEFDQPDASSFFGIQGYQGTAADTSAVETFVSGSFNDTLTAGSGGLAVLAKQPSPSTSPDGFGTCQASSPPVD